MSGIINNSVSAAVSSGNIPAVPINNLASRAAASNTEPTVTAKKEAPPVKAPAEKPPQSAPQEKSVDLASSIAAIPAPQKSDNPPSGFARWTNKSAKPLPNIPGLAEAIAANGNDDGKSKKPSIADFIKRD